MSHLNEYLNILWQSLVVNLCGFYNYFSWNTEKTSTQNPEEHSEICDSTVQMSSLKSIKNIDEIRSIFEFLVSKKVSSDVTELELINMIKTEIQYVNKKMSMARSVSQVSVEDIVLKTKLNDLLQEFINRDFYVEQVTEIINY